MITHNGNHVKLIDFGLSDTDDFARFVARGYDNCPYFQLDDEYRIVRHQM